MDENAELYNPMK